MTRKRVILVMVLAIVVASAPIVMAHQQVQAKRHAEDPLMFFVELRALRSELNLSPEQVGTLKAIGQTVRESNADYRASMKRVAAEAGLVLLGDPSNTEGAEALLRRNDAERVALRANVLEGISKAIKVLTPEQREILEKRLSSHVDAL